MQKILSRSVIHSTLNPNRPSLNSLITLLKRVAIPEPGCLTACELLQLSSCIPGPAAAMRLSPWKPVREGNCTVVYKANLGHPGAPLLPSPSPNSGRRRVVSCVGRLEVPTFLNLDGAPPPSLPCSPSPSTSGGWPPTKEEVVKYHRMMSKENQCCLCNFKISDPSPDEG